MRSAARRCRIRRGTVYWVRFGETAGSEQGGLRPALVIQNDIGNRFSPTTLVLPVTSKTKHRLPTHYMFVDSRGKKQTICAEQVRVVDKSRVESECFRLNEDQLDGAQRAFEAAVSGLLSNNGDPAIKRGQIYECMMGKGTGSEETGVCPVVIVQNDKGNQYSPTTIVIPLLKPRTQNLPTHARVKLIGRNRVAAAEQVRAVDKSRLRRFLGTVPSEEMSKVERAINAEIKAG